MSAPERPDVTVTVTVTAEIELTHAECWPDWNVEAEQIDPSDYADLVADLIRDEGGVALWMESWNLERDLTAEVVAVHIEPNPAYGGDEVLFGDPPPREIQTISEAKASS